jgi:hypothetical protein
MKVIVNYPSALQPFKNDYPPSTAVSVVKADALAAFGLKEEQLPGNQQVVFFLFHGKQRIEDFNQPISAFAPNEHATAEFRLAREVIAG